MKITKDLTTSMNEAHLHERVNAHMTKRGFKQVKDDILTFKRGSAGGSFRSFSPEDWLCKATILYDKNRAVAKFEVDTRWQIVLPWEKAFWNSEVIGLKESIEYGNVVSIDIARILHRAILLNFTVLPLAVILAVFFAGIVFFLPFWGISLLIQRIFDISMGNAALIGLAVWCLSAYFIAKLWIKRHAKRKR